MTPALLCSIKSSYVTVWCQQVECYARAVNEQLKALLAGSNALKSGQEDTKKCLEEMQRSQEETTERMEKGQQEMQKGQERMQKYEDKIPENQKKKYASEIEMLANLALSEYAANVGDIISLQSFVSGLTQGEIQRAVKMANVQNLISSLVYVLKCESAYHASRRDRYDIRGVKSICRCTL
ncbi:hypothetical protein TNCV_2992401 [Trichonephila clavipes]|nr:hypothetical protein TNCV_2992401 [Trichonephila clavipes]